MTRRIPRQRDTFAYRLADNNYLPEVYKLTDRLQSEFTDWWNNLKSGNAIWKPPFDDWGHIEDFLKENYAAAHRGLDMGMEAAQPLIDEQARGHFGDHVPLKDYYPSGPEAIAEYGYDPKEIAAGMLLLHNEAHGHREDLAQMDHDRLYEIAQKRYKMQRDFEQRAAGVDQDVTARLMGEFKDWHKKQPRAKSPFSAQPGEIFGHIDRWENVEKFLKDRYPAAHRGLEYGLEDAGALLDGNETHHYYPDLKPYPTGLQAEAEHGYDPREVAAAMLLLHNKSDRFRDESSDDKARLFDIAQARNAEFDNADIDVLHDIAQKRHRMQHALRTAMPVPTNVPGSRETWERQYDKLNEKAQKAGLGVELLPNFSMNEYDFYEQSLQHSGWDVKYPGKGKPGIAHRRIVLAPHSGGIPINYLIHHGEDGKINGILSHFPKGTPYEKPGSITVTVHPAHRGKGIGTALVQAAQKKWKRFNLDEQQFTPLGYELYRNVKRQQGETMPNIFNEPESEPASGGGAAWDVSIADRDAEYVRQHTEKKVATDSRHKRDEVRRPPDDYVGEHR